MPFGINSEQHNCKLYQKHHNIIDGIYTVLNPKKWEEIPPIDDIDAEDDTSEFYNMFLDLTIYDINDIKGFNNPPDNHGIKDTIFIIRKDGQYYLCETQGVNYVKYSTNITSVSFIKEYDRKCKLDKISNIQKEEN